MAEESFTLRLPHTLIFGAGKAKEPANVLPAGVKNVLLVCGSHTAASGDGKNIQNDLESKGISVGVFTGVPPEPPPEAVDDIVNAARNAHAEAIVALGGGSVIDASKAAAAMFPMNCSCMDCFTGKVPVNPQGRIPLVCMPTTAGTGAESTSNAVLTDRATKIKQSLRHPSMMPEIAIVDPLLTLGCPAQVTAASGLDALVQAIESYISPRANSVTRGFAFNAFQRITRALVRCVETPDDIQARTEMAEGSMLAGIAFSNSGLGAIHGIAHPLGSLLHVPHGVACSVLMLPVFRFNAAACSARYAELFAPLAAESGIACTAENFLQWLEDFRTALNIPKTFQTYGITRGHWSFIVANCRSGSMKNNPVYMTDDDVRAVLASVS